MAIADVELMHDSCFQHLRMGTARMKEDKDTEKEGKEKRVSIERNKEGTKNTPSAVQTIAQAYIHSGSLIPETVYELPN